jgi:hypothetical protein
MRAREVCLLFTVLASCALGTTRGVPLYEASDVPHARGEVALLLGPIKFVDGKDVGLLGSAFELLPGCHVVQIGGHAGHVDRETRGGWVTSLPSLIYAFQMRAGFTYTIDVALAPELGEGPMSSGRIIARERDAQGRVRVLPIAPDLATIDACH